MNLKEYATTKYLHPSSVTKYMKAHPETFDGLYSRDGKSYNLSAKAVEHLDQHFTRPAVPAEYLQERTQLLQQIVSLQDALLQANETIDQLRKRSLWQRIRNK